VIVQPKPERLQNIMMMFAIHNTRKEWDPLPAAYKLRDLEGEFKKRMSRLPSEKELAELASLTLGEIRRLKNLLGLPEDYRKQLMKELEKPPSEQVITADVVLEATRGAAALKKRAVIDDKEEDDLRRAIIDKYRSKVILSGVAPRQLARIGRAVDRDEISTDVARRVTKRLIDEPGYSIDNAFSDSVAVLDLEHSMEVLAGRLNNNLKEHQQKQSDLGPSLRAALQDLVSTIRDLIG
jgi:hypothetical protein